MPLTKQAQSLLDMAYRIGAPRFHELSVAQARHSFQKLQFAFRPEVPAVASVTEVPIGRRDGSVLLSRFYRPIRSRPDDRLAILLYLHGGGWCVGDVESYDVLCREIANQSGCAVLSVDYRLAPEHPFPAAIHDALLAFEWVGDNADLLNVDPDRIAFGGDSAGGNLSLVAAIALRDEGATGPAFLALVYPCTEIHSDRPSRIAYNDGFFLDQDTLEWFFSRYLPDGGADDWRASPMRAGSLAGLPPMLLITAEYDPLTDDCDAFVERTRAEGGRVEAYRVPGMVHGFLTLGKLLPEARETVTRLSEALARGLGVSPERAMPDGLDGVRRVSR
ncbi:alpha/beta hydrolase [Rhodocyclaceae bacterium SMB388]